MSRPIVILDTETTSLRRDRRVWEIGLIRIDSAGEREVGIYVHDVDLSNADLMSLRIGRFYDRHPGYRRGRGLGPDELGHLLRHEADAALYVEELTHEATIVGAVPNFDTEGLGDMLYRHRLVPAWHYHLLDVETLVAGYLIGRGETPPLPWKSEDLSRAIGVDPAAFERHTALGDCRWVLAQLKVVAPELITAALTGQDQAGEGR